MKTSFTIFFLGFLTFTFGQNVDAEGDVKIRGHMNISHPVDTTSVLIGPGAGINMTVGFSVSGNTMIGTRAGNANTDGNGNTFVGSRAGLQNIEGDENAVFGHWAGERMIGDYNSFFGAYAGQLNTGSNNTFFGYAAGIGNNAGSGNTFYGSEAGTSHTGMENTTLIGYNANVSSDGITKAIAIGSSAFVNCSNCAVIGGTGSNAVMVGIGTNTPNDVLDVVGDIDATGCIKTDGSNVIGGTCLSDRNLKFNIQMLGPQLHKILKLRPSIYQWKDNIEDESNHIGLIAQEVEEVIPEMVTTDSKGNKRIQYDIQLQIRLIKALQEQQEQIELLKRQVLKLQKELLN